VVANESKCLTPDPTEEEIMNLPYYGNETFLINFYDSLERAQNSTNINARVPGDIEDIWLRIPVRFWLYQIGPGNPGGTGDFPNELRIQRLMDELNNAYKNNGIKIRFYLSGTTPISNESALVVEGNEDRKLAFDNKETFAINIHVVSSGGAFWNGFTNAIFINREDADDRAFATTIVHEVGHYFGLNHTHLGSGKTCLREPVTRGLKATLCPMPFLPRCMVTGDHLCSTPADPGMHQYGSYTNGNCTWDALGTKDHYGETFKPDTKNYMAYGNSGIGVLPCRTNFSSGQIRLINYYAFVKQYVAGWRPNNANAFDRFEPDNAPLAARILPLNTRQSHTFHTSGRTDNVDWLSFTYNPTANSNRYFLDIHQITANAVGTVNIFQDNGTDNPTASVLNITNAVAGNIRTFTIP
jgi:hypothetical protein